MPSNPAQNEENSKRAMAEMSRLRRFTGAPQEFWQQFMAAAGGIAGAARCVLVLQDPKQPGTWRKLGDWTEEGYADRANLNFNNLLVNLAQRCLLEGNLTQAVEAIAAANVRTYAVAVRLQLQRAEDVCVAVLLLPNLTGQQAQEAMMRVELVADTPASFQSAGISHQAKADVEKFASALDILTLVNQEKRFLAATLALCNGVATRFGCDRVSLGWLENGFIKLKTISRTERFDRKMEAVKALEIAMEEALDQDEEILLPPPEDTNFISKDHQAFAKEQSVANLASIPIRLDDLGIAVLTCERQNHQFNLNEIQQLRLTCDQAARRLSDLYREDRWLGARLMFEAREQMAKFIGPEHTWAKALGILIAVLLIVTALPVWNYRVEGNFTLKSEEVSFLTAPFDGYIKSAAVRPGDTVTNAQVLLNLNTVDLELELARARADLNRLNSEAVKAEAEKKNAEMQIAKAQADQVKATLALIRYRLDQSSIRSLVNGVVVEGDLRQRIGAPVKQGEGLFRVSRTDSLYVEAEVNEKDIHNLKETGVGQIAFLNQPRYKFPIKIIRIEPAAMPKKDGNVFIVRCALEGRPESGWRPGMSGICKLESGRRSLLWIMTHRTIDFLRLKLWW